MDADIYKHPHGLLHYHPCMVICCLLLSHVLCGTGKGHGNMAHTLDILMPIPQIQPALEVCTYRGKPTGQAAYQSHPGQSSGLLTSSNSPEGAGLQDLSAS
jgi:hypothetical protein